MSEVYSNSNACFRYSAFCMCACAGHGVKTGTNLYAALYRVSEMISFFKRSPNNHFNETQNIIIIETDGKDRRTHWASLTEWVTLYSPRSIRAEGKSDKPFLQSLQLAICVVLLAGYSNTGKKPQIALAQIRGLLGYRDSLEDHTDETMLGIVSNFLFYILWHSH